MKQKSTEGCPRIPFRIARRTLCVNARRAIRIVCQSVRQSLYLSRVRLLCARVNVTVRFIFLCKDKTRGADSAVCGLQCPCVLSRVNFSKRTRVALSRFCTGYKVEIPVCPEQRTDLPGDISSWARNVLRGSRCMLLHREPCDAARIKNQFAAAQDPFQSFLQSTVQCPRVRIRRAM